MLLCKSGCWKDPFFFKSKAKNPIMHLINNNIFNTKTVCDEHFLCIPS